MVPKFVGICAGFYKFSEFKIMGAKLLRAFKIVGTQYRWILNIFDT